MNGIGRSRVATTLLGATAVLVTPLLLPLLYLALLSMTGASLEQLWLAGWAFVALALVFANTVGAFVLWQRPRPRVTRWQILFSLIVLLSCPFLWTVILS